MFRESFDVYNLFCPCFDGLLVITCQQPSFQGGKGNCVLRNDYELNTAIISSPIHNVNSLINIYPSPQWRPHSLLRLSAYNKYNMHHENTNRLIISRLGRECKQECNEERNDSCLCNNRCEC